MINIIQVAWFTSSETTIGIVVTENDVTDEHKAYVDSVEGNNVSYDATHVAKHGAKFPLAAALIIMKNQGETLLNPIKLQV